ncbi:MAG: ribosomal protein S6 modification protein [Thiotrichales bacterium SG8_50]|nr:MAG: ribosomal protein S6 modification protein [Thiotrichales bacterium SG8_50]
MKKSKKKKNRNLPVLGWTEWVALPDLAVPKIKCKVDTGARTSALHAFYVEGFQEDGKQRVRFGLHPDQGNSEKEIHCVADVLDTRNVTDSGGHIEARYVILTPMVLGTEMWPIEITLTNRDTMRFRMLLGRTAIADNFLVDSGSTMQMGRPSSKPAPHAFVGGHYDEEE